MTGGKYCVGIMSAPVWMVFFDLSDLNYKLAKAYAQCVNQILAVNDISAENILAIGCHGQTVYYQPQGAPLVPSFHQAFLLIKRYHG